MWFLGILGFCEVVFFAFILRFLVSVYFGRFGSFVVVFEWGVFFLFLIERYGVGVFFVFWVVFLFGWNYIGLLEICLYLIFMFLVICIYFLDSVFLGLLYALVD